MNENRQIQIRKTPENAVIHPAIDMPKEYQCGPAMSKLNERQQAFVVAMLDFGGRNNTKAALAAGYAEGIDLKRTAYRLAHDELIQAAIKEEGQKRLNAGTIMAVNTLLEIADSASVETKDKLKAVEMILNRTGMHATTEHKVAVTHQDATSDEMIKRIEQLAGKLGVDPQKLLGNCAVDVEYSEVQPEDDLSDIYE